MLGKGSHRIPQQRREREWWDGHDRREHNDSIRGESFSKPRWADERDYTADRRGCHRRDQEDQEEGIVDSSRLISRHFSRTREKLERDKWNAERSHLRD